VGLKYPPLRRRARRRAVSSWERQTSAYPRAEGEGELVKVGSPVHQPGSMRSRAGNHQVARGRSAPSWTSRRHSGQSGRPSTHHGLSPLAQENPHSAVCITRWERAFLVACEP